MTGETDLPTATDTSRNGGFGLTLERLQALLPRAGTVRQPGRRHAQLTGADAEQHLPAGLAAGHEAGALQHGEMLDDGLPGHRSLAQSPFTQGRPPRATIG
jgi:hypothetical protein